MLKSTTHRLSLWDTCPSFGARMPSCIYYPCACDEHDDRLTSGFNPTSTSLRCGISHRGRGSFSRALNDERS